ncbi:MAG TPA: hypothetical protein VGP13_03850 [Candidatus Paceibacterota bacterium]|nr:hypothetical protein [Candidatus Paceibacterota bacterium]
MPILHAGEGNAIQPGELDKANLAARMENIRISREYTKIMSWSLMEQLNKDGLLNKKRKFIRPTHLFLDGASIPGHEYLRLIREQDLHRSSYLFSLVTRLHAAGAVFHRTELGCLNSKRHLADVTDKEVYRYKVDRLTALRDVYIAYRIRKILGPHPEGIGILLLGAAHQRIDAGPGIRTQIFHRGDLFDKETLEYLDLGKISGKKTVIEFPDDFGHVPPST